MNLLSTPFVRFIASTIIAISGFTLIVSSPVLAAFPEDGFSDIAKATMPAYVDVITSKQIQGNAAPQQDPDGAPMPELFRDFFGQLPQDQRVGAGSGFIINSSGIIVTNNHVIDGADQVAVRLQDGTILDATIVGVDARTDLAVLKVEFESDLPFLTWGDSDAAEVGDWSLAIGNPFGLGPTMTLGIISARARDISNAGPYVDFIQTDAPINRGNSGGPLLNVDGQVIGINSMIFSPTGASVGIGFAIPSKLAERIVEQLIEFGRPRRGWLGVRIQRINLEIAEGLGLEEATGALIAQVDPDGPAGRAGIEPGDVILSFDGKTIPQVRALQRVVADTEINSVVNVEIWRDRSKQTIRLRIGELTEVAEAALMDVPRTQVATDYLGMDLAEVTPQLREQFDLTLDSSGVLVTGVKASSVAAEKLIKPGDLILEVAQREVGTPEDVIRLVQLARQENRSSVLILLQERDGDRRFVALSLDRG